VPPRLYMADQEEDRAVASSDCWGEGAKSRY